MENKQSDIPIPNDQDSFLLYSRMPHAMSIFRVRVGGVNYSVQQRITLDLVIPKDEESLVKAITYLTSKAIERGIDEGYWKEKPDNYTLLVDGESLSSGYANAYKLTVEKIYSTEWVPLKPGDWCQVLISFHPDKTEKEKRVKCNLIGVLRLPDEAYRVGE